MKTSGRLECFGCGKDMGTGDSIRFMTFIYYDLDGKRVRRMIEAECNTKITEFIELLHKRRAYNNDL